MLKFKQMDAKENRLWSADEIGVYAIYIQLKNDSIAQLLQAKKLNVGTKMKSVCHRDDNLVTRRSSLLRRYTATSTFVVL
jgi:hypothetical protein